VPYSRRHKVAVGSMLCYFLPVSAMPIELQAVFFKTVIITMVCWPHFFCSSRYEKHADNFTFQLFSSYILMYTTPQWSDGLRGRDYGFHTAMSE